MTTAKTTKIKLDPMTAVLIDSIKRAHHKTGAPGIFLALLEESNQYFVQLSHGIEKCKYSTRGGRLTVINSKGRATVEMKGTK